MKDKTAILWYCIPSKQLQKFVLVLVQQRLVAWLLMATEICTLLVVYMLLIVVYATDTNETSSLQKDIHEAEAIENKEMKNTLTPLEKTQLITAENHYSFMKFRSTKQHDVKQLFLLSRGGQYFNKTKKTQLKFKMPKDLTQTHRVTSAALHLRITKNTKLLVMYLEGRKTKNNKLIKKVLAKRMLHLPLQKMAATNTKWVKIDLTKRLKKLSRRAKFKSTNFIVEVTSASQALSELQQSGSYLTFKLFPNVLEQKIRKRREEEDSQCFGKSKCCLKRLWINFKEDLNWEPLYPPIYKLLGGAHFNYCSGECSRKDTSGENVSRCCIATKFRKISLLVKKEGSSPDDQSSEVKDLEVDAAECSCK